MPCAAPRRHLFAGSVTVRARKSPVVRGWGRHDTSCNAVRDREAAGSAGRAAGRLAATPAPALVLGGVLGLAGSATLARLLLPIAGVVGAVALRLAFAATLLVALHRPSPRMDRRTLRLVVLVGATLVAHHLAFYAALQRLPLGVAVTLEFSGPLALALSGSRRLLHVAGALTAAAGVVAVSGGVDGAGHWSATGAALALGAGVCWAAYIVVFPQLTRLVDHGAALAAVTSFGAVVTVPLAVATTSTGVFTSKAIGLGAVVAVLADVVAYSLQANALGRISGRLFSVLSSTEPAMGALLGLVALGQHLSGVQWSGVLAVAVASAGASRGERAPGRPSGAPLT
jgi:inner membrane transporter RhtA